LLAPWVLYISQWRINGNRNILNLTIDEQNYLGANIHKCSPPQAKFVAQGVPNRTNYDIVRLMEESALFTNEFLVHCFYQTRPLLCDKLYNRVLTHLGFCYTYNMQGFTTIFNERAINEDFKSYMQHNISITAVRNGKSENITLNDDNAHWTIDDGYFSHHNKDITPRRATKKNEISTFTMIKKIDVENICRSFGYVLTIIFHMPNEMPTTFHKPYYVTFDHQKTLILDAKLYSADPKLRNYAPQSRGCYFQHEKQLKFFKSYTKAHCDLECMTNYTLKLCGCVRFSMPRDKSTPVCDLSKTECYIAAIENWPDINSAPDGGDDKMCGCLASCNEIKYFIDNERDSTFQRHDILSHVENMSKEYEINL
jgi:amiloride-sensitive sodium channel